jgi:tetratricopeptide (TPR) repeat protein
MRLARCGILAVLLLAGTPVAGGAPGGSWERYWREAGQAQARGRYVDAAKLFSKALAVAEAARPPDDRLVESLEGLAGVYRTLRREVEAESLLRRAVGLAEQLSGPRHPAVAQVLAEHAAVLRGLGREIEADAAEARLTAILTHPSVRRPSIRWQRAGAPEADLAADEAACAREARYGISPHGPLIDPDRFTGCIERRGWRPRVAGADEQAG